MKHTAVFRFAAALCAWLCLTGQVQCANAQALEETIPITLTAPSVMLVESESGAIIFERNADERRPVASVTKLMTVLIVMEKLENEEISLTDQVTVSANAASMIGSQALLDAHQVYPLETLLKSTIVASGNDSAVALAEYIAGTEEAFAALMNERAQALGMKNTHYANCTGLPAQEQYTTARDISMLCREMAKHENYHKYATIWMDQLTHPSGRVTDLTNTNRLVRFYTDCDGFKTGSTNEAKYCIAATAQRNGMRLIAIVLGAESGQKRFDEARAMLDYGFATYRRTTIGKQGDRLDVYVPVRLGVQEQVEAALGQDITLLLKSGQEKQITLETDLIESVQAPVEKGTEIGVVKVIMNGEIIARIPAVAADDIRLPGFIEGLTRIGDEWK
ncbi:MAG: D-alanyl-D-alanine carboxypeptidase [Clostridia bacterium]|nr:D-alanyl-D-alanine carboxypeptidase [Clostridia bacterium]